MDDVEGKEDVTTSSSCGVFGKDGAQEPGVVGRDIEDEDLLVVLLRDGLRPLNYPALG